MCGITGFIHFSDAYQPELSALQAMTDVLIHRGPDDVGFFLQGPVGLGFRRLSIIDLADGNQPMCNEDGSVVSVCNGEVYNYKTLRQHLEARGHQFRTQCDVEVLPHLYEEYGADFVSHLNGQFALALFDRKQGRLLLARDHVGIAPLFYTYVHGVLIFASEIKAILQHPLVEREVDLTGLDQILTFPGLVSPRTMFKNIHSLRPGHLLLVQGGHVHEREYWDLIYPTEQADRPAMSEDDYLEQLDAVLRQAVAYRLQADVPVGFYVSGGVDSSLIAALIHDLEPSAKRHSFSIGFEEADIDERRYQRLLVDAVASEHHETVFDWQSISSRLRSVIYHAEMPLRESYDTCSLALSELVKRNRIKVIMTGEGADELFAGYVGYRFDQQRQRAMADPLDVEVMLERQLRQKLWGDASLMYEKNYHATREIKAALYTPEVLDRYKTFDCLELDVVDKDKLRGRHPVHQRSYLDFKLRLADHLLADHGDRVAYANSVEIRYPFLDIDVVAFTASVPPDLLLKGLEEKYLLKRLARRYVPHEITQRQKFSFVAPGSPYLIRHDVAWLQDLLSYERIKQQGYFNPDTVERLKARYRDSRFRLNQTYDDDLLMVVLTFGIFLETFDMPNLH
jgi:asparagine synthase (glutamine-hydrolysing)